MRYARDIAPWWGIDELAVALLALPAGLLDARRGVAADAAPRAAATVP